MKQTLLKIGVRGADGIPLLLWFIAQEREGEGERGEGEGVSCLRIMYKYLKMRITIC